MNDMHSSDATAVVFDVFLVALKKTFDGEPWAEIAPWAERVWAECREEDDADWESIKDSIQAEWQIP